MDKSSPEVFLPLLLLLLLTALPLPSNGASVPVNTDPVDLASMRQVGALVSGVLPSWTASGDPCSTTGVWQGVTCNTHSPLNGGFTKLNGVTSIVLAGVNLGIDISAFQGLSGLTFLVTLDLSNTGLTGTVPSWTGLYYLTSLSLAGNAGLTGPWPETVNSVNMPQLKSWDTTGTAIQNPWTFLCQAPTDPNSYFTIACVGSMATKGGATITVQSSYAPCSSTAIPANQFVSSLCNHGSFTQTGHDRQLSPCSAPGPNQYVIKTCASGSATTLGSDTVFASCASSIPTGSYLVNPSCTPGAYNTLGSSTTTAVCSTPSANQYVVQPCFTGTANVRGTNTVLATCASAPTGAKYITALCTPGAYNQAGSNLVAAPCSQPAAGQYVNSPCVPGDASNLGSDTVLSDCSNPTGNLYVSAVCSPGNAFSAGSDTEFSPCGDPTGGQITASCAIGAYNVLGYPYQVRLTKVPTSSGLPTEDVIFIVLGVVIAGLIGLYAYYRSKQGAGSPKKVKVQTKKAEPSPNLKHTPKENTPLGTPTLRPVRVKSNVA